MIRLFKVAMTPWTKNTVAKTLDSGYIGQGPRVEQFEQELEWRWNTPVRPLTLNSCTSALDLAYHLIGVGPGDYVITTPQTCTATNSPIVTRGAVPLWADVDEFGLIKPSSVRALLDEPAFLGRVKAVVAVDWAGTPADYKGLREAAPGLPIVQDAAHRLGGVVGGDYVAWSFQAIKFLTTGDGGALLVPQHQYERAKLLRWYGLDRESSASFRCAQDILEVGFKYHMNDISASIGLANVEQAERNLTRHRANAMYLADRLGLVPDQGHPSPVRVTYRNDSHYWFFPLALANRDGFIEFAAKNGVEASQVHARNDKHRGFPDPQLPIPGVDWFDTHQVAIPCGWWLTKADLDKVANTVLDWIGA